MIRVRVRRRGPRGMRPRDRVRFGRWYGYAFFRGYFFGIDWR